MRPAPFLDPDHCGSLQYGVQPSCRKIENSMVLNAGSHSPGLRRPLSFMIIMVKTLLEPAC